MEISSRNTKNKPSSYRSEIRFEKITSLFEELFKTKKFPLEEFFNIDIWFLYTDKALKNILKNKQLTSKISLEKSNFSETPLPLSKFHEILSNINESNSPAKIKIQAKNFIEKSQKK